MLLCMNVEIHRENFTAHRVRRKMMKKQRAQEVCLHKLEERAKGVVDPPSPELSAMSLSVPYENWNNGIIPWAEVDEEIGRAHV